MTSPKKIFWTFGDQEVYLTFDDGPDKHITPKLLRLLDQQGITATFFLLGSKTKLYPKIVNQINERGHSIGNHGYSHESLLFKSRQEIYDEIKSTEQVIYQITGLKPKLFRPPFGRFGLNLLSALKNTDYRIALWNASSQDYKEGITTDRIHDQLKKCIKPGKVVLLHDGHNNSSIMLEALSELLRNKKTQDLIFSSLPSE